MPSHRSGLWSCSFMPATWREWAKPPSAPPNDPAYAIPAQHGFMPQILSHCALPAPAHPAQTSPPPPRARRGPIHTVSSTPPTSKRITSKGSIGASFPRYARSPISVSKVFPSSGHRGIMDRPLSILRCSRALQFQCGRIVSRVHPGRIRGRRLFRPQVFQEVNRQRRIHLVAARHLVLIGSQGVKEAALTVGTV